jgi:hypothetical protein
LAIGNKSQSESAIKLEPVCCLEIAVGCGRVDSIARGRRSGEYRLFERAVVETEQQPGAVGLEWSDGKRRETIYCGAVAAGEGMARPAHSR